VLMYRRRPSAALVPSRASLPRTSWVELKLRDNNQVFSRKQEKFFAFFGRTR
jgi:hypothetical protein